MPLAQFMSMGEKYAPLIQRYRAMKQEIAARSDVSPDLDPGLARMIADAKEIKCKFPAASLSGYFSPTRAKGNLQWHSGFICVDIDDHYKVTGPDGVVRKYSQPLDDVCDILEQLPYVLYAGNSVGGKGYFAIIPLAALPNGGVAVDSAQRDLITERHEWYFDCLQDEFSQMGIIIDSACSDTTRLRVLSYNSSAAIRRKPSEVIPYEGIDGFISKNTRKRNAELLALQEAKAMQYGEADQDAIMRTIIRCVEEAERRGCDVTGDDYKQCLSLGFAFYSLDSVRGYDLWRRLCRFRSPALHTHFVTEGELLQHWQRFSHTGSKKRPDFKTILFAFSHRANPPILFKDLYH